jgi:transcriptional regulator with XRE-family HTH domain
MGVASRCIREAGYEARQSSRAGCGPLIRAARQRAGLSQTELARRAGMVQSKISDYERGRWHPTRRSLLQVAQALGCPIERLLPPAAESASPSPPEARPEK